VPADMWGRGPEEGQLATRGSGGRVQVVDLGLVVAARGYVCDAHAIDAEGVVFTVRVTAPARLGRAPGVSEPLLRRAAGAVACERAHTRLRAGAFGRGAVYRYVVTDPWTARPLWRSLPDERRGGATDPLAGGRPPVRRRA
jgi:hypothetical protein